MKKTIIALSAIIVLLVTALVFLLISNLKMDSYTLDLSDQTPSNVVDFQISFGSFSDEYETTGVVTGENYLKTSLFSFILGYSILIEENQDFSQEDPLLEIDGESIGLPLEGRIISWEITGNEISLVYLDYSCLYVSSKILNEDRNRIGSQTPVTISLDGNSSVGIIRKMGYVVEEGFVETEIDQTLPLLPGTIVGVTYVRGTIDNCYFILNEFLSEDNLGYYIYLHLSDESGEEFVKQYVEVVNQNDSVSVIDFDGIENSIGAWYAKVYW